MINNMNEKIYINKKIEVRKSPMHGWGVFAKENIICGEILEECHHILFSTNPPKNENVLRYTFKWPRENPRHRTLPLGFGCIYNSALKLGENNADWETDEERNIFIFKAVKDIFINEEILTFYFHNAYVDKMKRLENN